MLELQPIRNEMGDASAHPDWNAGIVIPMIGLKSERDPLVNPGLDTSRQERPVLVIIRRFFAVFDGICRLEYVQDA
jgi:hypothetical protein